MGRISVFSISVWFSFIAELGTFVEVYWIYNIDYLSFELAVVVPTEDWPAGLLAPFTTDVDWDNPPILW